MINILILCLALLNYYPSVLLFKTIYFFKKGIILVLAEISEEFKLPVNCLCDSPTAISFFEVRW